MSTAIILGSGTSNGVPMLGMQYTDEFLSNAKNHRTRSSIIIQGPKGNFLVDCAPEMRLQLLREKIQRIEGVLITHTHADHVMGMDDLRSFCIAHRMAMPVFTLPQYQQDIKRIYPYAFVEHEHPDILVPRFELTDLPTELDVVGLRLKIFVVGHGKSDVVAFRVNDFAYFTDVNNIPEEVIGQLSGLKTLVLDAVRYRPHPNHFHYEQSIEIAKRIGAEKTYFTHLSADYDHDRVNDELPAGIELAYDGLRISI